MLEKCFDLSTRDIDMYFETLINVKIGSPGALNVHIAALSSLFEYLMNQNFDFRSLHGYINTNEFRNKYLTKIDAGSKKGVIPNDILVSVLNKIDKYYQENKTDKTNNKYYHFLVAKLYVYLSLLIPLKPIDMAKLKIGNIKDEHFEAVEYNAISIKIPKSVKNNILETIDYAEVHYQVEYNKDMALFEFLYGAVGMQPKSSTISEALKKLHKTIGATEMLKTYKSGTKNVSQYPVESYKI